MLIIKGVGEVTVDGPIGSTTISTWLPLSSVTWWSLLEYLEYRLSLTDGNSLYLTLSSTSSFTQSLNKALNNGVQDPIIVSRAKHTWIFKESRYFQIVPFPTKLGTGNVKPIKVSRIGDGIVFGYDISTHDLKE